jgi:paraquat-inducible protein A
VDADAVTPRSPVICEFCDAVYERAPLSANQRARCACCGAELYRDKHHDPDVMLALTLASLVVFLIANSFPIVSIEAGGARNHTTLIHAVLTAYDNGMGPLAIVTAVCVFFFPLLQIGLFAWLLLPLRAGRVPPGFVAAMHALRQMAPWSMVEVFLIGTLVSVVKLAAMATVIPQTGLWAFAVLTCLITALHSFDLHALWHRAEALQGNTVPA